MLIIVSHPGEVLGREDFGSVIWELEFHQLIKIKDWEENVRSSLLESILRSEPRLRDVSLEVRLAEIDEGNADNYIPSKYPCKAWRQYLSEGYHR
jgi:bacteriophage gp25 protein